MKSKKVNIFKQLTVYFMVFALLLTSVNGAWGMGSNVNTANSSKAPIPYTTGLIEPSKKALEWYQSNAVDTKNVKLNSLGLSRVNNELKKHKLPGLKTDTAVPLGQEVASETNYLPSASRDIDAQDLLLPPNVDNSQLPAFPPIGNQLYLNCCASFATTYYQMTYMTGLARGWTQNKTTPDYTHIFSPKWTYKHCSDGNDGGSSIEVNIGMALQQGCLTWDEYPYVGDTSNIDNYRTWCTDPALWTEALNYKMDRTGYVNFNSEALDTVITSGEDTDLSDIKTLLNNGYVLTFGTDITSWVYGNVKNDPSTNSDDSFPGQLTALYQDNYINGHAMTIVGYNNDIWSDINSNNQVDPGEKGAFKIANSWGADWGNNGFVWIAYDALNKVSYVQNSPAASDRYPIFRGYTVNWMTAKTSYTPDILAEFTLNTADRGNTYARLGYSQISGSLPTLLSEFTFLERSPAGNYAFDGSTQACDGTFVLDFTDMINKNNIDKTAPGRWYLSFFDVKNDGSPALCKSFKIIDVKKNISVSTSNSLPVSSDGENKYVYSDYTILPLLPDSYEPNNSFEEAKSISSNDIITATIHQASDLDYYKFDINETSDTEISLAVPSNKDYDIAVYNSLHQIIGSSLRGAGLEESISLHISPGTYYVYVYGYSGSYSSSPYTLTISSSGQSAPTTAATPTATPTVTPTPTPINQGNLILKMYNGDTASIINTIYPKFMLVNNGTTDINLSDVKIRYYYTVDGDTSQNFSCDWSTVGQTNVTHQFIVLNPSKSGADYYLEIGFNSETGSLSPGSSIEIQSRISKNDWSNYTQSNDYSFNPSSQGYIEWNKATVYVEDQLQWGIEP